MVTEKTYSCKETDSTSQKGKKLITVDDGMNKLTFWIKLDKDGQPIDPWIEAFAYSSPMTKNLLEKKMPIMEKTTKNHLIWKYSYKSTRWDLEKDEREN